MRGLELRHGDDGDVVPFLVADGTISGPRLFMVAIGGNRRGTDSRKQI